MTVFDRSAVHDPSWPTQVDIYDTTLRDGSQLEGISLTVDDKLRILDAVKKIWGARVTTVLPRQGQYAHDAKVLSALPPADVTIERIGDLLDYNLTRLRTAALNPA